MGAMKSGTVYGVPSVVLYHCPQPFSNQNSSASQTRMWCLAMAERIDGLMGRILVDDDLE